MKRFHVHLNVTDLAASIRFYSELFASEPGVRKPDYAKWMLDDPRVNFAISNAGRAPGIDHLGIQVDRQEELAEVGRRLEAAGSLIEPEPDAVCCYARSDKLWSQDPQGTRWESFHTTGEATTYYAPDAPCANAPTACSPATATLAQASIPACCAGSAACA
jgi:catechol 2,3-dioxygenase-like lactoylglutathione lyase family enzyme